MQLSESKMPADQAAKVVDQVKKSVTGDDEPLARKHPHATGAMVWLTYPLTLIAILFAGLAVLHFMTQ